MGERLNIPNLATITATEVGPPPTWALMERKLISLMERAAPIVMDKYYEASGTPLYADDVDDLYERSYNWGLFYAMGADEEVLRLNLKQWNGVTRFFDDGYQSREHIEFTPQLYNEYYNLGVSHGAEWHHKGEGNQAFYHFGLADPTISENVRRARRFAAMYIGEDLDADNYDPKYRVLRSPMQSSQGPQFEADLNEVKFWLHGGHPAKYPDRWVRKAMGTRASLYPVVKDLDYTWYDDPAKADEIVKIFNHVVLDGDIANNLCATALVTHAYLNTGDEKYKRWVLDYVDAWVERAEANGGIIPDNVGPTGKVGEHREGQWWGGLYGWNHYRGYSNIFHAVNTATECAHLLSGDAGYLDLMRNQINALLNVSVTRDDGHLLVPTQYGPDGWRYEENGRDTQPGAAPLRMEELAHLYHGSMSKQDYDLIDRVRSGDIMNDWNEVPVYGEKGDGRVERARFNYYDGKNPDWPMKALSADYQNAQNTIEQIAGDDRDTFQLIEDNVNPPNPIFTKALTQVMFGAPQTIYNGGILQATVRYFDTTPSPSTRLRTGLTLPRNEGEDKKWRPGLPLDVSALVDELKPDFAGVQLVNTNRNESRRLIIQAGAFGEHQFTSATFREGDSEKKVPLDSQYLAVMLPPSTAIRVGLGMKRFVNNISYAFPWHGGKVPSPFQETE
jgi:hypothetical protein